jgi:hydroxypyruvate isomerase
MTGAPLLSAHIGYLFSELPLENRFAAAAAAGFGAIEHPAPFELPAPRMIELLRLHGLRLSQISSGLGAAGEKGLAALPGREPAFREGLKRALDYAETVGCPFVHPMAGVLTHGVEPERAKDTWLANIAYAQRLCRGRGVDILVEPISQASVPGYFLDSLTKFASLAPELANSPFVLLDTFHAANNREDAPAVIASRTLRIGHVHIADHPGRAEPGTGGIAFEPLLQALAAIGYRGAIGFEYIPKTSTEAGLGWLVPWHQQTARLWQDDIGQSEETEQ